MTRWSPCNKWPATMVWILCAGVVVDDGGGGGTVGDSGLFCCVCVASFKHQLTPLFVDSTQAFLASFCFRLFWFFCAVYLLLLIGSILTGSIRVCVCVRARARARVCVCCSCYKDQHTFVSLSPRPLSVRETRVCCFGLCPSHLVLSLLEKPVCVVLVCVPLTSSSLCQRNPWRRWRSAGCCRNR